MKIISVSDVITNSSSEVFCIFDKYTFNKIKELFEIILATFGVSKKFDELFELVPLLSDEDISLENAFDHDSERDDIPYIIGYRIIAKDSHYDKLAERLSNLQDFFNYETIYC